MIALIVSTVLAFCVGFLLAIAGNKASRRRSVLVLTHPGGLEWSKSTDRCPKRRLP